MKASVRGGEFSAGGFAMILLVLQPLDRNPFKAVSNFPEPR